VTPPEVFLRLGNVLIIVSAIEASLFVVLYHCLAAWHRAVTGRIIMGLMLALALVLDVSAIRLFAGASLDTTWFLLVRLAVFCGVPVTIGWLTIRLIQLQLLARRPLEGAPPSEDIRP
jgi:hypothetical protein